MQDEGSGRELTFLPLHRSNMDGEQDPNLFAFLCFKTQLDKARLLVCRAIFGMFSGRRRMIEGIQMRKSVNLYSDSVGLHLSRT